MTEHDLKMIELYNKLYTEKMMWFILGSLISAENFWTEGTHNGELIKSYEYNISQLKDIERLIDEAKEIPEEERSKIKDFAINGIKLLESEMENIKK